MGNKHSTHKTFKKYNHMKKNKTLKNRKIMRGGGEWIQHKDDGWVYQLSNKAKIGSRTQTKTRQKKKGEVKSVIKASFDWLDTSNLNKTRDKMTDFDIKKIADGDDSNIGYISGSPTNEPLKPSGNDLDWGSLNPRKNINKSILGLNLETAVNKADWFEDTSIPGNSRRFYYVHKTWKRNADDNISDFETNIYGKEPNVGYTKEERVEIDPSKGILQGGGGLEKEVNVKKGKVSPGTRVTTHFKRGIVGEVTSYENGKYIIKFEDGKTRAYKATVLKLVPGQETEIPWTTKGNKLIGAQVLRRWEDDGKSISSSGRVTKWAPEGPDDADGRPNPALWHVVHDDGDEEDLELDEVDAAIKEYKVRAALRAAAAAAPPTDDEDEEKKKKKKKGVAPRLKERWQKAQKILSLNKIINKLKTHDATKQSKTMSRRLIRVTVDDINYENLFSQKQKKKHIKDVLAKTAKDVTFKINGVKKKNDISFLQAAESMNWPQITTDAQGTLHATDKRPNPGWVPLAIIDREPFCMGTGSSAESLNEAASVQSEYSMDDAGGMWRGWAWRVDNTYWAQNSEGTTTTGVMIPWLFTTKDMVDVADEDKLLTDPNLWDNFEQIREAFSKMVAEAQDVNLGDKTFKLMDITKYITKEEKKKREIVNLDFEEKYYYPNISERQGWVFYYQPTEEEAVEQFQFGIRGSLDKYRQAIAEYKDIAGEVRISMDSALLYPILPQVYGELDADYVMRLKEHIPTEEAKSWDDIVYFTAAPELRKIGITCDHVHDATDEGRCPPGRKSFFSRIKVKAHMDILQYLSDFFRKYNFYSKQIKKANEVEQTLFKRCTHEMLQLTEEYMERPTTQIKDQTMKDVWNRILENTNSMSMYITCSIPKPRDTPATGTIINQIRIIPSASIAHVLLKKDLNQNKNKLSEMMQDEQISTNNFSSYFAKVRHRIMGFISNEDPRVIFEREGIRKILDKGHIALITINVDVNTHPYPTDERVVSYKEQIFDRKSKEVIEVGSEQNLSGESKIAWNRIFKYSQSGSNSFTTRRDHLKTSKRVMLSDMLTGLLNDATVVEGLNEAGIFEGPISVGNRACIAIPPTPSLNDHAASMHCAGRKKRRQITVDSIIPNFKYDSKIFDDKRMNLAFANNITLQQMNPIYQDVPDIKINMNRKLYKMVDSRVWSMLFGEEFSEYIESETCGVHKLNRKVACGACQCGAGTKFVGVKLKEVNCPNLKAKDIKEGKEKTIFKFNDAINNYFPKKSNDHLKQLDEEVQNKYGGGGQYTLFKQKGERLVLKASLGGSQVLCSCHLLRVFDNADEYVKEAWTIGGNEMKINTPDTLVGVDDEGGEVYEQTMPLTANNLKAVVMTKMSDDDKKRLPKPCSQYCLCKGLCWGNILLASNAVSKINNIFKETEVWRCGIKERAKIKRDKIRHLIDYNKEEVYCLVNILLQKYHSEAWTVAYKRCEVALEYINEIAGDGLLPPMLLGRFLEIFLQMVRFDFNSGTDFYTFIKVAGKVSDAGSDTSTTKARRKERHKPQELKYSTNEELNIIWNDREVTLDDVWNIFRYYFQKFLKERTELTAVGPTELTKKLPPYFVWIPDFQILLLGIFTSLINLHNSTLSTGGPTHGQGVNLTIADEVVCYSDTAAMPMMNKCMDQLTKQTSYAVFNSEKKNNKRVSTYWASKLAKWSGDAHQNMMAKICGYLLISSDEISFMTTRLIKGSRLCSVIASDTSNPKNTDDIFNKINFKTGDGAQSCGACGDKKSGPCDQPGLIGAVKEEVDSAFVGNDRFFNCFYSGESAKRGEQALFLHLLRLSSPEEDIGVARQKTMNKLYLSSKGGEKQQWKVIEDSLIAKKKQKKKLIKKKGTIDTKNPEYKGIKGKAAAKAAK